MSTEQSRVGRSNKSLNEFVLAAGATLVIVAGGAPLSFRAVNWVYDTWGHDSSKDFSYPRIVSTSHRQHPMVEGLKYKPHIAAPAAP